MAARARRALVRVKDEREVTCVDPEFLELRLRSKSLSLRFEEQLTGNARRSQRADGCITISLFYVSPSCKPNICCKPTYIIYCKPKYMFISAKLKCSLPMLRSPISGKRGP